MDASGKVVRLTSLDLPAAGQVLSPVVADKTLHGALSHVCEYVSVCDSLLCGLLDSRNSFLSPYVHYAHT